MAPPRVPESGCHIAYYIVICKTIGTLRPYRAVEILELAVINSFVHAVASHQHAHTLFIKNVGYQCAFHSNGGDAFNRPGTCITEDK